MRLPMRLYSEMKQKALDAFPEECCGFVLYDPESEQDILRPVTNVATERHKADPENYPRDGTDGYFMDESQLLEIQRALDEETYELRAIYHSHPNGKAYFSKEDEARAMLWDEPIYPDAVYLVLGCDGQSVTGMTGHVWNEATREFEDIRVSKY